MPSKKKTLSSKPAVRETPEAGEDSAQSGRGSSLYRGADVGRDRILARYWELANLDPEVTKGTITGQLKALDALCEEIGLAPHTKESAPPAASQAIYRSAWMQPADGGAGSRSRRRAGDE
ncbi:MAG TPA: hypothetical protein VGR96_01365 [Acidobacteriaceae bacterium]|nr:hypothetical protein [Acidobacteriaceae bacterium]